MRVLIGWGSKLANDAGQVRSRSDFSNVFFLTRLSGTNAQGIEVFKLYRVLFKAYQFLLAVTLQHVLIAYPKIPAKENIFLPPLVGKFSI